MILTEAEIRAAIVALGDCLDSGVDSPITESALEKLRPLAFSGNQALIPSDNDYDAANRSPHTLDECQEAVGKRASLTLTGTIIQSGTTEAGSWVKFEVDTRWGFPVPTRFVMDLDPFIVEDERA